MSSIEILKKEIKKKYVLRSEQELMELYHLGRFDDIINSVLPLVFKNTGKYYYRPDYDELIGEGLASIKTSLINYDETKGKLTTHIGSHINFAVLNFINYKKHIKDSTKNRLNNKQVLVDVDEVLDLQTDDEIEVNEKPDLELVLKNLKLSKMEKKVFEVVYIHNKSLMEANEILGFENRQSIYKHHRNIKDKIKDNPNVLRYLKEFY